MRFRLLIAVMGSLMAIATIATAEQIGALLTGYEESPSVSTTGRGEFTATIDSDGDTIFYSDMDVRLRHQCLQSAECQAVLDRPRIVVDDRRKES